MPRATRYGRTLISYLALAQLQQRLTLGHLGLRGNVPFLILALYR